MGVEHMSKIELGFVHACATPVARTPAGIATRRAAAAVARWRCPAAALALLGACARLCGRCVPLAVHLPAFSNIDDGSRAFRGVLESPMNAGNRGDSDA